MATTESGIWFPDKNSTANIRSLFNTMATSIENTLGVRMKKQEQVASLRATTPQPFVRKSTSASTGSAPIPLSVTTYADRGGNGNFNSGNHAKNILLEGNVAKIQVSGFYSITAQLTTYVVSAPHSWDFKAYVNGYPLGLNAYGTTFNNAWSSGYISDNRYLTAGDQISLACAVGTDHIGSFGVQDALLSISMIYAT